MTTSASQAQVLSACQQQLAQIAAMLAEVSPRAAVPTSIDDIKAVVARTFHVPADVMEGPGRMAAVVEARNIAMFLARRLTRFSLAQIGTHFGGRHYTTVHYAITVTERLYAQRGDMAAIIDGIIAHLDTSRILGAERKA